MAKIKTHYICQNCGATSIRWVGKCAQCYQWNTVVEEIVSKHKPIALTVNDATSSLSTMAQLLLSKTDSLRSLKRISTGIQEFDRVLGGGLVLGSVVLLGGEPGIGKSTLLLQMLGGMIQKTLYASAEESLEQVADRGRRLQIKFTEHLYLQSTNDLSVVLSAIESIKPEVVIIDSLQTMFDPSIESASGTVAQVREVAHQLVEVAKKQNIALILVGQINKEGMLAGPKVVEHLVDVVLYFESETSDDLRILYVHKNRFGAAQEVGLFEMQAHGLCPVSDPSLRFLSSARGISPGALATVHIAGTRPLVSEIQALAVATAYGMPRRTALGVDNHRLAMLLAVIERHAHIPCLGYDIFLNVVGGLKLTDTSSDLAAILAIVSSLKNKPIPADVVAIGEVGLSGEIRSVQKLELRLEEAGRRGLSHLLTPFFKDNKIQNLSTSTHTLTPIRHVKDAIDCLGL